MSKASPLTLEQRWAAIEYFVRGYGPHVTASWLGVRVWTVKALFERWQVRGTLAVMSAPSSKSYSLELKHEVVHRFLAGETAPDLAAEYEISSPQQVRDWVLKYRKHGAAGLRPQSRGRPPKTSDEAPTSELEQLREQNLALQAEVAYLKKLRALRAQQKHQ